MADFDPNSINANAAMLALINSSRSGGGGGKQGWADGMINKGAQTVTSAHGGGGLKLVGAFGGTGRGMFGSGGDKLHNVLASIGDSFLKSFQNATGIQAPQIQEAHIGEFSHGLGRSNGGGGHIDLG